MAQKYLKLGKHLRDLAAKIETIDDEGRTITKGEALAQLLFKKALGYTEVDPETHTDQYRKPEAWAIQMIFERLEGRVPQVQPTENDGVSAAERITDLARAKINLAATTAASPDSTRALPRYTGPVGGPPARPAGPKRPG